MNGLILTDAQKLINAQRQDNYGTPAQSFLRISTMWSAYLGHPVSCRDVACLGRERDRFERELQRGAALDAFAVVVEAGWADLA